MRAVVTVGAALAMAAAAVVWAVTPDKPIPAEVYVKTAGPAVPLRGSLVSYDEATFTLRVNNEDKTLGWTDVTPATAFVLRQKTIDRSRAEQLLKLGRFGWDIGAKDQAQSALKSAVRMDASLKPKADEILAGPYGTLLAAAATRPVVNPVHPAGKRPPATRPGDAATVKFQKPTPEQIDAAMKAAREQAESVESTLNVQLSEFETDHFLVFTDWPQREYGPLKTNLEAAYRIVSRQFDADPKETVFVGKLPVYMLARYDDFAAFAKQIDGFADVNEQTAGYYQGDTRGYGHMAMWKPSPALVGNSSQSEAERLWGYVLVHEFTHAFLARYKSNAFVPRWLNEGIAEVIAYTEFPYADRRRMARLMAGNRADVKFLFDDTNRPSGEYYPVMQSMVEFLLATNKPGFQKMIDAIKNGTKPEQAMRDIYHADYDAFIVAWQDWAKRRSDK